jgi:peptidoglycan/LPS O-acetylase OafA/YrhL
MAIALLILASMQHSHEVMARPLSFRPLAWLGTISYSIYLWQEPLMGAHNGYVLAIGLPILSLGSYYLVERPAVRLGHRLTQGIKPTSQIIDCDNLLAAERGQRIIS